MSDLLEQLDECPDYLEPQEAAELLGVPARHLETEAN